jgi:hypothetical protein
MRMPHTTEEELREKGGKTLMDIARENNLSLNKLAGRRSFLGIDPVYPGSSSTPYYLPKDIERLLDKDYIEAMKENEHNQKYQDNGSGTVSD